jgi:hypothetical protein
LSIIGPERLSWNPYLKVAFVEFIFDYFAAHYFVLHEPQEGRMSDDAIGFPGASAPYVSPPASAPYISPSLNQPEIESTDMFSGGAAPIEFPPMAPVHLGPEKQVRFVAPPAWQFGTGRPIGPIVAFPRYTSVVRRQVVSAPVQVVTVQTQVENTIKLVRGSQIDMRI